MMIIYLCAQIEQNEKESFMQQLNNRSLVNIRVPGDRHILIDTLAFELKYIDDHVLRLSGRCSHFVGHQAIIFKRVE